MGGRRRAGAAEDPVGTLALPAFERPLVPSPLSVPRGRRRAATSGVTARPASGETRARRRIFIAVALAPTLRHAVAGLEPRFSAAANSLRWVAPDHLHFTLKFLGEITGAEVTRAGEAARQVGARTRSFAITVAGMGAFPSPRRPQVVWAGVSDGADRLIALAGDLDEALRRMKFPRERRPFQPHLTVARVRRSGPAPDLTAILQELGGVPVGTQAVEALLVMESTLNPSGSIYSQVEEVRLGEVG